MSMTFYHFMMTYKGSKEHVLLNQLAEIMAGDIGFPKQEHQYNRLSSYMEESSAYTQMMGVFDQAWELYKDKY